MPKVKDPTSAKAQLAALNLRTDLPAKPAASDVDPRTMPVADIVFDPALLDEFPSLEGDEFAAASRKVFASYKSYGRSKDRNRRLHDEIGLFIHRVRRAREAGVEPEKGAIKAKVKATKKQRDFAAVLAEHGLEVEDLTPEQMTVIAQVLKQTKESE